MPEITLGDTRLHYNETGDGPETLLFIHGLMLASESWVAQVAAFSDRYRVITFDLRGQGRSAHSRTGLDLDSLAADTVDIIQRLCAGRCHLIGFSMGAFVGLRVAARRPDLVSSLTLIGASAEAEAARKMPIYGILIWMVKRLGPKPFTAALMRILFGVTFLSDPARAGEREYWRRYLEHLPRSLAYAAEASAHRKSIAHELPGITAPALIISGAEDRPVPPETARAVAQMIDGAEFLVVPETGHAVMIERPELFNRLLDQFLVSRKGSGRSATGPVGDRP